MGNERLRAGSTNIDVQTPRNKKRVPTLVRFVAPVLAGLGVGLVFTGSNSVEEQVNFPAPTSTCSQETIKYPPDLEREYLVPCKRISDFILPQELVDPVDRLKRLEEEVEKINPDGAAVFANEDYAVGIIGDSTVHIWERLLPKGSMVIEAVEVTDPDDFEDKVQIAICDLKEFLNKGQETPLTVAQMKEQVNIVLGFREQKGLDIEKQRVLSEFRNSPEMQSIPECD